MVGRLLEYGTVKGGTGWGAEFATLCNQPLCVFDQDRDSWHQWSGTDWVAVANPTITHRHFAGTGTRFLEDNGAKAIEALFARSLG